MRGREVSFQTKGGAEKVYSPEFERFFAMIWNTSARLSKNGTVPSLGCALWMGQHRETKRKQATK